jgi:hypothetical protein
MRGEKQLEDNTGKVNFVRIIQVNSMINYEKLINILAGK